MAAGGEHQLVELLAIARQKIQEGQPSAALQLVIAALRAKGGDIAVFEALHRARMIFHGNLESNQHVDELSALFTQCVITSSNSQPILSSDFNDHQPTPSREIHTFTMELEPGNNSITPSFFQPNGFHFNSAQMNTNLEEDAMLDDKELDSSNNMPLLVESGRSQVLMDASSDGSSFTCPKCFGIVNLQRQDEHFAYWCSSSL